MNTAALSEPAPRGRQLAPGQRCEVWVAGIENDSAQCVFQTDSLLLEAPNWTGDDRLLLNGDGDLWSLSLKGGELTKIAFEGLPPINNDHVLDHDRELVYMSANDGHIYRGNVRGGVVQRITSDDDYLHFLHGVSPDGHWLAFVELPRSGGFTVPGILGVISTEGGVVRRPDAGNGHIDGPEYSPDGEWIYLNSEHWAERPGHAQLARVPATGGKLERLMASDTVDWFPHLSPDGSHASYISFPTGTLGHPADLDVAVRVVPTDDWGTPVASHALFGGQGTINVNSWAPAGDRFAFVAYPIDEHPRGDSAA